MSRVKDDYFDWLMDIAKPIQGERSWLILMKVLNSTEFEVLVPNDINRCIDGCGLREEFRLCSHYPDYNAIMEQPCSVLELLLSLARTMDFELSGAYAGADRTHFYFWELLENLGLDEYDDLSYAERRGAGKDVKQILRKFISRDYDEYGRGGVFPLRHPNRDQRYVELWNQMGSYLQENHVDER